MAKNIDFIFESAVLNHALKNIKVPKNSDVESIRESIMVLMEASEETTSKASDKSASIKDMIKSFIDRIKKLYGDIASYIKESTEAFKEKIDTIFKNYRRFINNNRDDITKRYSELKDKMNIEGYLYNFDSLRKVTGMGISFINNLQTLVQKVKLFVFGKHNFFSKNTFSSLNSIDNIDLEGMKALSKELDAILSTENVARTYKKSSKDLIGVECENETDFSNTIKNKLRGENKTRKLAEYDLDMILKTLANYTETSDVIKKGIELANKMNKFTNVVNKVMKPNEDSEYQRVKYDVIGKLERMFRLGSRFEIVYYTSVLTVFKERSSLYYNICKSLIKS